PQGVADRPPLAEAEVRRRQRGRVGAGRVQGPRGDREGAAPTHRGLADRRARDRVDRRLHLHPRRVPDRVRDPPGRRRRGARGGGGLAGAGAGAPPGGGGATCGGERPRRPAPRGGGRAPPPRRPPSPPVQGLYDAPTQINNVCTIATVPAILELGAEEFAKIG